MCHRVPRIAFGCSSLFEMYFFNPRPRVASKNPTHHTEFVMPSASVLQGHIPQLGRDNLAFPFAAMTDAKRVGAVFLVAIFVFIAADFKFEFSQKGQSLLKDLKDRWAQVAEGKRGEPSNVTEELPPSKFAIGKSEQRLLYVHIGKCGGSTLACRLKKTYQNPNYFCMHETLDHAALNSTLSKRTREKIHYPQKDKEPIGHKWKRLAHGFSSFLVIVRNPMTRTVSEFYYSQTFTEKTSKMKKVHNCYKTVGELAEGIAAAGGWHPDSPQLERQDQCGALARKLVSGQIEERSHFRFNFEFFAQKVLKVWPRDVFILRNEHLWDDYSRLDSRLGGRGVRPLDIHIRSHSDTNHTMSSFGRAALCQLLCREFYYYKLFLLESKNLNSTEVQQSWDDLELQCPGSSNAPPTISQRFTKKPALRLQPFKTFGSCTYET